MFKSQNNTTWEPSQWEDLKFTLYRGDFVESGSIEFYNPELTQGNAQIAKLLPDPISIASKKIRVGLGTTVADNGYEIGNTFFQDGTNATGDLVGTAGSATGNLSITNAGLGLTPLAVPIRSLVSISLHLRVVVEVQLQKSASLTVLSLPLVQPSLQVVLVML